MDDQTRSLPPHIIVFPSPLQSPINPIFDLAELLSLSGLDVTFLLISSTHSLLLRHIHVESRLNPYPNFRLHTMFDGNNMDSIIKRIPGIKGILTGGDLASTCPSHDLFHHLMNQIQELPRANGLILNTFKALDEALLSQIRSICPKLYAIGPIYMHLGARQEAKRMTPLLNYSVDQNNSCLIWLNSQQPKSVLYVNIENHEPLTQVQTMELWHGLVNNEQGFLWVRRPDSTEGRIPPKLMINGTKKKGLIVDSASNEQVLVHKAIGGFLTDGEWDSTLQSMVEGVPIICCPSSWHQRVNSKFVSKTWKVGIHMEERWDRNIIEKTIRDVDELIENANKMKKLGRKSVSIGGSSYAMLDHLVNNIRSMNHHFIYKKHYREKI